MSKLENSETPIPPIRERDSDPTTKAPSPEIEEVVYDADDGDAPDPTIQQIFDQEKSWLLENIRLLLCSVSKMELADDFDENFSFYDLPIIARRIVRRLERIEHLNCIHQPFLSQ
jgi:hypothetical protein